MDIKLMSISPEGTEEELGIAKSVERFEAKLVSGYYVTAEDNQGRTVRVTLEEREDELICEYPNGYKIVGEIL